LVAVAVADTSQGRGLPSRLSPCSQRSANFSVSKFWSLENSSLNSCTSWGSNCPPAHWNNSASARSRERAGG
jgi:hypothetical protein